MSLFMDVHNIEGGVSGNADGGRPAHFGNTHDLGPGASFCNRQANSKPLPARPNT